MKSFNIKGTESLVYKFRGIFVQGEPISLPNYSYSMLLFISNLYTLLALALPLFATANSSQPSSSSCRCIPGDACWPDGCQWHNLNGTVRGHLIATVPLAEVCHDPFYNATACALLAAVWDRPETS